MRKLIVGLLLLGFGASLPACTSKGSNLLPLTGQRSIPNTGATSLDGNGGGPSSGCTELGCPDPTPTP